MWHLQNDLAGNRIHESFGYNLLHRRDGVSNLKLPTPIYDNGNPLYHDIVQLGPSQWTSF